MKRIIIMKKSIYFFIAILSSGLGINAQTQNTASGGEVSSDFLRPGVVITTMNFSGVNSMDLGSVVKPAKFDNFNIDSNSASLSISANGKKFDSEVYDKELEAYVKGISGKVIEQALFVENGKLNFQKLLERSKNSMTEAQRNVLKNLTGSLDDKARDLLLNPVLDNNYVIVVSPTEIELTTVKNESVYTGKIATSVYKIYIGMYENAEGGAVDMNAQRKQFLGKYGSDFSGVSSDAFPVKKIFSSVSKLPATGADLGQFYQDAVNIAILEASKKIEDFKTRSKVEEKMLIALGTKEGLKVDDRYFSYEKEKDPETREITLVRKGIDRVKKVGNTDVDLVANPNATVERSLLYGDGGKKTRTGYISMEAPEYGIGVSGFYRANPGARIDYRAGKYVGVSNLFVFVDAEFVTLDSYSDSYTGYVAAVGIQKNFNLGRMFALAPFAQYAATASFTDESGEDVEIPVNYAAGGLRAIIKLGPSLQLMPEVTFMFNLDEALDTGSVLPNLYDEDLYFGGALRFSF